MCHYPGDLLILVPFTSVVLRALLLSCVSTARLSYSSSSQSSLIATVLYTATTTQFSLQHHWGHVLLLISWGNLSQWHSTFYYFSLWLPGFPADASLLLTVLILSCSVLDLSKVEVATTMVYLVSISSG